MKTIGLLGGMSWESTSHYYRLLNQKINTRLGGLHSAKISMVSVEFQAIETLMREGNWDECAERLADNARQVELAGADFLLLCTNTLHKVAETITDAINIPFLHIADCTARRVKKEKIRTVGLLGTSFTMEEEFYRGRLTKKHGIEVIIPAPEERKLVHDIIFQELCRGEIKPESRRIYLDIIEKMGAEGAEAVIEGCTEIDMLVNRSHTQLPLFDTTALHVDEAVNLALAE